MWKILKCEHAKYIYIYNFLDILLKTNMDQVNAITNVYIYLFIKMSGTEVMGFLDSIYWACPLQEL